MAQGSKKKYTSKQKRKAEHIEEGYEKRGTGTKEAERRAWATVNKQDKGGKKSGSGRGKKRKVRTNFKTKMTRAQSAAATARPKPLRGGEVTP